MTSTDHDRAAASGRSSWWLAYGYREELDKSVTWRDDQITIGRADPQFSPDQRFVVVGDVWLTNRIELLNRIQGQQPGDQLSDVQIVACLWESQQAATLLLLDGMFALAVWDRDLHVLTIARDRVGARTMYYTVDSPIRWVAPRLQTLGERISRRIDLVALRDYLCCAFVPGDRTLFRKARELRPGTSLRLPDQETNTYWSVEERVAHFEKPFDWHAERLQLLLEQVVREYLPPREAVGIYLSGGLDSSLVVALAAKFHTHPIDTYSIHFGKETPNELEFSRTVAANCGTRHHIVEITPREMWDLLPEAMFHLDDPIGDPLTVPNLILGRAAKQAANVILNGEGGDPCFGGPKNQPMLLTSVYRDTVQRGGTNNSNPNGAADLVSAYLASFQKCSLDLPRLLRRDIWEAVKTEPSVFESELSDGVSFLNRLMFINTKFKGADHILTKVNNITQAVGLEGRSPLFDQRIVEMSLEIPPQYKLDGADEKAVLKSAVRELLPDAILKRPKSGMMVPVQLWFRTYWRKRARSLLLDRNARIREYLNQDVIREWLEYRNDTWSRYGVKLWLLVSLELWLQTHQPKLS